MTSDGRRVLIRERELRKAHALNPETDALASLIEEACALLRKHLPKKERTK